MVFGGNFKNIVIYEFFVHTEYAPKIFLRMLSMRRQFFSAHQVTNLDRIY
jgi:hypothetical protein